MSQSIGEELGHDAGCGCSWCRASAEDVNFDPAIAARAVVAGYEYAPEMLTVSTSFARKLVRQKVRRSRATGELRMVREYRYIDLVTGKSGHEYEYEPSPLPAADPIRRAYPGVAAKSGAGNLNTQEKR